MLQLIYRNLGYWRQDKEHQGIDHIAYGPQWDGFIRSRIEPMKQFGALGEPPQGWHLRNNLFKYHAACYMTHAPIECAKEIRLKSNFPPERVKKIVIKALLD